MGTDLIVLLTKPIECALLRSEARSRRPAHFRLERAVHPLVAAVLVGTTRENSFRANAEMDPPDREARKPTWRQRGERSTVVGANRVRQTEFAKS